MSDSNISIEKIKNTSFNSSQIQKEFDQIEKENKQILKGTKSYKYKPVLMAHKTVNYELLA